MSTLDDVEEFVVENEFGHILTKYQAPSPQVITAEFDSQVTTVHGKVDMDMVFLYEPGAQGVPGVNNVVISETEPTTPFEGLIWIKVNP